MLQQADYPVAVLLSLVRGLWQHQITVVTQTPQRPSLWQPAMQSVTTRTASWYLGVFSRSIFFYNSMRYYNSIWLLYVVTILCYSYIVIYQYSFDQLTRKSNIRLCYLWQFIIFFIFILQWMKSCSQFNCKNSFIIIAIDHFEHTL